MLAIVLLAQTHVVPWSGQGLCPPGYYRYGGYCTTTTKQRAVERTDTNCPPGTYATGSYCTWTNKR